MNILDFIIKQRDDVITWVTNNLRNKVSITRKINGKELKKDITLDASDVGAVSISHATYVTNSAKNGNIIVNDSEVNVYTHPTTAGNKHIPSGGSSGQILKWSDNGTAVWGDNNALTCNVVTTLPSTSVNGALYVVK